MKQKNSLKHSVDYSTKCWPTKKVVQPPKSIPSSHLHTDEYVGNDCIHVQCIIVYTCSVY